MERAFAAPLELTKRLGRSLDVTALASFDPDELGAVFSRQPALHRFPGSMAKRVQELCQLVVDQYGGDAATVWTTAADGKELLRRISKLPGFGEQKAKISGRTLCAVRFPAACTRWGRRRGRAGQVAAAG